MKEIYKRKYSSRISLLWFLILMLVSVNSCKKDTISDLNVNGLSLPNLFSQLPEKEKIHSKEILDWVKNLPDLLPTDPFWDKAEQKVIVGRHVVRVPISDDASLYFTKQNDSLKVFVYKWIDKDPGKRLFTGNIISYNFQDERLRLLRYNKSKLFLYSTFDEPIPSNSSYSSNESFGSSWINRIWDRFTGKRSKKNEVNPSFTLASNKLKSSSKNLKSVTNSAQAQGLIGALMCFLQGGTYDGGAFHSNPSGTMGSGRCTPGGGAVPQFFDWLVSLLGQDGGGAYGDDNAGGYIGSTPYNGDPGSSGNNTYIPPSTGSGTTGGGSGGGTTTPPLPPYGGGAIWVSKWVPDESGGCTPTESGPSNDPNGVSQPGGPVGCPTGGGGHWEQYQINPNDPLDDPAIEVTLDDNTDAIMDDDSNYSTNNYDNTIYAEYQQTDPWPTITNVIPKKLFVPIVHITDNCFDLAKSQIGLVGYQISGYGAPGQTIQAYTEASGVNFAKTKEAVSYIIYALSHRIPVFTGVDNHVGAPPSNHDGSTNHFIVIVGMGTDSKGTFFSFFDSSTNYPSLGANDENKLYYNSSTGLISGRTQSQYGRTRPGFYDYILTNIRKSKPL